MKSRKLVIAFLAALALAVGLVFFLWPRDTADPRLHLKIVGHAVENGKLVVFFKMELADRRRIQITWVEKVIGDRVEAPFKFNSLGGERGGAGLLGCIASVANGESRNRP